MTPAAAHASVWSKVLHPEPNREWLADTHRLWSEAQERRAVANYNTGSITEEQAYCLRAIAEYFRPRVVLEVGTFIGTSALSLAGCRSVEALYTCDFSNDCLPKEGVLEPFPRQTSTQMLLHLAARHVKADLCFFDGVLSTKDRPLLAKVTGPRTVYVFDDYNYGAKQRVRNGREWLEHGVPRKGIGNVELLRPNLPHHVLIEPQADSILALLVPEALL